MNLTRVMYLWPEIDPCSCWTFCNVHVVVLVTWTFVLSSRFAISSLLVLSSHLFFFFWNYHFTEMFWYVLFVPLGTMLHWHMQCSVNMGRRILQTGWHTCLDTAVINMRFVVSGRVWHIISPSFFPCLLASVLLFSKIQRKELQWW